MNSNGEHPLQNLGRWLHVRHALFHGPRAKTVHVYAFAHCNAQVLVPNYFPVRSRCLVEQNSANGEATFAQHRFCNSANWPSVRQISNDRQLEKVAGTAAFVADHRGDFNSKLVEKVGRQERCHARPTFGAKLFGQVI
ncbi:MAG TPA: hypothetical protein VFK26_03140 [Gemmatimonadaceae bacterium]|nr:hypothetical protein [Gemmatimonadaceae bacterium]